MNQIKYFILGLLTIMLFCVLMTCIAYGLIHLYWIRGVFILGIFLYMSWLVGRVIKELIE